MGTAAATTRATAAGVDSGATLAKIALRDADGRLHFQLEPAGATERVAGIVEASGAARIGLTGAGASVLARRLGRGLSLGEFEAWGRGAGALSRQQGNASRDLGATPHLLVSLGTGTSVLKVEGEQVERVGGTALGGGTLLGLGAALLGTDRFAELTELAARGSRQRVDLLVSDLYPPGEIALAGEITAASFGKLARDVAGAAREDVAHALMGMVGENVALICAGLAATHRLSTLVYAGATLRQNPTLVAILETLGLAFGLEVVLLEAGEFAGALGALLRAEGKA